MTIHVQIIAFILKQSLTMNSLGTRKNLQTAYKHKQERESSICTRAAWNNWNYLHTSACKSFINFIYFSYHPHLPFSSVFFCLMPFHDIHKYLARVQLQMQVPWIGQKQGAESEVRRHDCCLILPQMTSLSEKFTWTQHSWPSFILQKWNVAL